MSERTLVAGLLLMAGTLALLIYTEMSPKRMADLLGVKQTAAAAKTVAPVPPQPRPARTRGHRAVSMEPVVPDSELPVQEIVALVPPTPTQSDVQRNTPRQVLIAAFGAPDVSATWAEGAQLNEKLIYHDRLSGLEIYLRNGLVVSSQPTD